jgi:hypothetical protein
MIASYSPVIKLAQAGVEVAAQALDHQLRVPGTQDGFATQTGGADDSAGRQLVEAGVLVRNEGITRVLARRNGRQRKTFRHLHRHVLQGMHGKIGATFLHRHFQLLDEQPLAADLRQRAIKDLVATGGHAENAHLGTGV